MVERICPECQQSNPLEGRYCGKCGSPLERQLPVRVGAAGLTIAGRQLPVTWRQLSRTVALSVAALAAEAGLLWLRRRLDSPAPSTTALTRPAADQHALRQRDAINNGGAHPTSGVTIQSHRVVEIWDTGDGYRRIEEHHVWRRNEE